VRTVIKVRIPLPPPPSRRAVKVSQGQYLKADVKNPPDRFLTRFLTKKIVCVISPMTQLENAMPNLGDRIMNSMVKAYDKRPHAMAADNTPRPLGQTFQFTRMMESLKLLGAGNSAGAIASLTVLASGKAQVLTFAKTTSIIFLIGVLLLSVAFFFFNLASARFDDMAQASSGAKKTSVASSEAADHARGAMLAFLASTFTVILSFGCFVVSCVIALIAVIRF